jgi:hypothetical protein
VGDRPGRP